MNASAASKVILYSLSARWSGVQGLDSSGIILGGCVCGICMCGILY